MHKKSPPEDQAEAGTPHQLWLEDGFTQCETALPIPREGGLWISRLGLKALANGGRWFII